MNRSYRVYVYNYVRANGKNRPLAYIRYQGAHACEHDVRAATGAAAKRTAINEHLATPSCSKVDPHFRAEHGLKTEDTP